MSAMNISNCPDITIPNGTSVSNTVLAHSVYADADYITLYAPAGLVAGEAGVIQISNDDGVTWFTLNNNVSDVSYPVASKAIEYVTFAASAFRLSVSVGNVAADRVFKMTKAWRGC